SPELRDTSGKVYAIDKIEKFGLRRDFVVFSLKHPPTIKPLTVNRHPTLNQTVYTVGNALGTGVVIRKGLYTSKTPEAQSGAWQWLRFSAAASPGNSGGPLLDKKGRVIGVVLMKSPDENLNYALPIGEVLSAPEHLARINKRVSARALLTGFSVSDTFNGQIRLPLSLTGFFNHFTALLRPFAGSQLHNVEKEHSAELFPRGKGSHQLLYGSGSLSPLPGLIHRASNGIWLRSG